MPIPKKLNGGSFIAYESYQWGAAMMTKREAKYAAILDAAEKVIASHGFHGAKISSIAKAAGVADGTVYLYFKNKKDILVSLFRSRLGELVGRMNESIGACGSADEALRKVCEIHYRELERNVDLAYVTQIELRQSSLELRREIGLAVKPYILLIEHILRKGVCEKTFRPDLDFKLTRLLVFGAMDEVVTSWLIAGRKYSLSAQTDRTVEFFLRGLK